MGQRCQGLVSLWVLRSSKACQGVESRLHLSRAGCVQDCLGADCVRGTCQDGERLEVCDTSLELGHIYQKVRRVRPGEQDWQWDAGLGEGGQVRLPRDDVGGEQ